VALTALGFSLFAPIASLHSQIQQAANARTRNAVFLLVVLLLSVGVVALTTFIGGGDWNGFYQTSLTLFLWLILTAALYRLDQRRANYSIATVAGLLLLSVVAYKAAKLADLSWSSGLGATDDEIAHALDNYGERDASFALAHQILDRPQTEPCGDLCRIMREYTNVRDARVNRDLKLADPLEPTSGSKPNIFVVVIDSLRPDYLGAYNAKADFSPNLDAFAKDSIVVHNTYTEYAGTSLSEPAIWAGALLLHAHYMQPFAKINSLEKLLKTDGYRMVISNDEILDELLQASPELTKIDADKKLWNSLELCATVPQTLHVLDARGGSAEPVFFYTQPKNVHQFARNDNPKMTEANWRARPGFSNRVAYEVRQVDACLGNFLGELKKRSLYDNSIIIVTSDHGDATGELGRSSHSLWLYPEVMRVPLIVHLPASMRKKVVYDDKRVSTLTDITPSLYYLLGHKPVARNAIFGRPLFVESQEELRQYARDEVFMASDVRAAFGILADNGRYFYATYDSPPQSFLFDLARDPTGEHNVLNAQLKKEYDRRIIEHLQGVADFYGYKPGIGSLLTTSR
jgi:Sulfatase